MFRVVDISCPFLWTYFYCFLKQNILLIQMYYFTHKKIHVYSLRTFHFKQYWKKYQILICKKFTKNLSVFLYFSWTVYNKEKSTHNEELLNCAVLWTSFLLKVCCLLKYLYMHVHVEVSCNSSMQKIKQEAHGPHHSPE